MSRLAHIASQQHGVVTRSQFIECNGSPSGWLRMINSHVLEPLYPGVVRLFGYEPTRFQQITAATLSVGDRGISSHTTAAELWGAWTPLTDDTVHVIVDRNSGGRVHHGVKHHRPRDIHDLAPLRMEGIRVTSASRTLLDVAALTPYALSSVVERMLLGGHTTRHRIKAAVALHSKQGRTGIGAMRELLAGWPYSDRPADSVLELRMDRLLGEHSLPQHVTQIEEGPFRIDFGWPRWKVAGELDGWGKFDMLEQFERLTARDRYLQLRGWIVLHFTWRDVQHRPRYVINEISSALTSRGWRWTRESG